MDAFPGDTPGPGADPSSYLRAELSSGHEYDNTRYSDIMCLLNCLLMVFCWDGMMVVCVCWHHADGLSSVTRSLMGD